MNVKIEIVSTDVRVQKGKSRKTGEDYEMRAQEGYLHNGHHYPERFEVPVRKDADRNWLAPYAVGFYTLAPGSIRVNREFGRIEINPFELQLVRIDDAAKGK